VHRTNGAGNHDVGEQAVDFDASDNRERDNGKKNKQRVNGVCGFFNMRGKGWRGNN